MSDIILDDRQDEAVQRMLQNKRYFLFWDVGVGKTYPVLSRLSLFEKRMKILILAPAVSIKNMWEKERDSDFFDVFAKNDVEMHSFEWLAWNKKDDSASSDGKGRKSIIDGNNNKLGQERYDVIIIDEAHRLATSTYKSRSAKIIKKLAASAEYVYGLTGTPAPNNYQNLYPLLKNAGINAFSDYNYDEFLHHFFSGYNLRLPFGLVFKPTALKSEYRDEFMEEINRYCMFAQKQRTWAVEPVRDIYIPPVKTEAYFDALNGIYTDAAGEQQTTNRLTSFGKAYMILNGFQYAMDADGNNKTVEYFANPKIPYLKDIVAKELTDADCVIVCYFWKKDLRDISKMADGMGLAWTDDINEAQTKTGKFILLLQLKKGISVNLQDIASVMIFYTYNFSFVDYIQSIGRIDRRGQQKSVRIYRLLFSDSIESKIILKALETKQRIDYTLKTNSAQRIISKEIAEHDDIKKDRRG